MNTENSTRTDEITRGRYTFYGLKASEAAKWFDTVLANGFADDMKWLAWDSAHKFGASVKGPDFVSYRHGFVFGDNAEIAADFFNEAWKKAFDECPQAGRRSAMPRISNELKESIEKQYSVRIEVLDGYYY